MSPSKEVQPAYDEEEATACTNNNDDLELVVEEIPMGNKATATTTTTINSKDRPQATTGHVVAGLTILYVLLMGGAIFGLKWETNQCGEGGCHSRDEDEYNHFGRGLTILFTMGTLAILSSLVSAVLVARYWRDLSQCIMLFGLFPILCSITLIVIGFSI